jgi:hypothetical protein
MDLQNEYRKWWAKLSKEEKSALLKTGYNPKDYTDDGVPTAHRYFGGEPSDIGLSKGKQVVFGYDINYTSYKNWINIILKKDADESNQTIYTDDEVLEIINRVILVLDDCNDASVKLHAICIKIALGVPGQPTMTAVAKCYNLTRAAVSLRVKTIQRSLGITPSIYMKSEHACKKLSKARRRKL